MTAEERMNAAERQPALGLIGVILVGGFAVLAVLALFYLPYSTTALAGDPLQPPSWHNLLGTNSIGEDVLSQVLAGTQVSLFMALVAGMGTVLIGTVVGAAAGWIGGRTDAILMRVVDFILVIPGLPLLIVLGAYVGPSLPAIAAVIAITSWPSTARMLRSQVLSLKGRAHLRASVGFGAGTLHVMRHHVLPETSLIIAAALVGSAGRAVMIEAGLAFLGLGDPTRASWGAVMRDALNFPGLFVTHVWTWWLLPPVMAVVLMLLGTTFLGLALETRLAPRLSRHPTGPVRA